MKAIVIDPFEVGWYSEDYGPFELGESNIEFEENDLIRIDNKYYIIFDAYIEGNEYVLHVKPIKLKAMFHTEAIEDIYKFKICKEEEE